MNRLQKSPADKRQRSHNPQRRQSSSCSMAAVLISSIASLSTYCPPSSSALRPPPTSFVPSPHFTRRHYFNNRGDGGSAVFHQQPHHSISIRCTQKRSRIMLSANNDNDDNDINNNEYNNKDNEDNEEDEDEEEQDNELKSNLNKISWLPSVKLGKQPIHPNTTFGQEVSRKESQDGKGYATTTTATTNSSSSSSSSSPPGYKNIEILPVLPMTMVHGIEMLSYDDDTDNADDDDKDNDDDTINHNNHRHLSVDDLMSMDPENIEQYLSSINSYGTGVWEGTSNLHDSILLGGGDGSSSMGSGSASTGTGSSSTPPGSMFSGTSSYLPHTKGHVFTIAESRYKKLYDDLVRMGKYYGKKRESAIRREKQKKEIQNGNDDDDYGSSISGSATTGKEGGEEDIMMPAPYIVPSSSSSSSSSILPDPEEKRRFIVTTSHPMEDGVFAEYGLLFQLKDLDEVAAVASYETGGGEFGDDEQGMTMEEIQELVDSVDVVTNEYGDAEVLGEEDKEDVMDILLRTHYEATHDVVGRVKIHRFVNPECYNDGPEGDEYLMAEATILDVVKDDRRKMRKARSSSSSSATASEEEKTLATARSIEQAAKEKAEGEVAKAVARIKDELRSSVSEAFKQHQQLDPQKIKDKLRSALDAAPTLGSSSGMTTSNGDSSKGTIPLGPKGVYVEKRSDDSLSKEERALRESFAKLVALQHELKEECRFTRVSVQTFGIGPVGVWLSAAAWSQFVQKRLESSHGDMQSDLQSKLVEYLESSNGLGGYRSQYGSDGEDGGGSMGGETIDFDELSPELQQEFHLVQNRATEELGPLAMDRAIQMQRIVQAETYTERLDLLRECVDNERRRLEAKKMLQSLAMSSEVDGSGRIDSRSISREEARSLFEKLMSSDNGGHKKDSSMDQEEDAFQ